MAVAVGGAAAHAGAAVVADGGGASRIGNGKFNKNSISINSPEENHGIQHMTNTLAGGNANNQAGFCKWRFRHCRISQRFNAFRP
jgi:hypothetical protein